MPLKKMSNLTKRVLTAVLGVPILLFVFYKGGIPFLILILGIISVGQIEFSRLLKEGGIRSEAPLGVISSLVLGVAAYFGYLEFLSIFTLTVLIAFVLQLRKRELSGTVVELGATVLGVIYLGWFLSHAVLLRNICESPGIETYTQKEQGIRDAGFFYVVLVVACTFLNDTGAYFVGRWRGKRKLAPRISPGKTVEGTVGGIVCSILAGMVVNLIFRSPLEDLWALSFGLIIGIVSVFGDLLESLIKRSVGVKDAGGILPGHGGVLDRFDSLIAAFPVSYYFVLLYYWLKGVSL